MRLCARWLRDGVCGESVSAVHGDVLVDRTECCVNVRTAASRSLLGIERHPKRCKQLGGFALGACLVQLLLTLFDALLGLVDGLLSDLLRLVQESSHGATVLRVPFGLQPLLGLLPLEQALFGVVHAAENVVVEGDALDSTILR